MILPEKHDRSCPVRIIIFLWILRLNHIGESRKGHRKIIIRTGHDKEYLPAFVGAAYHAARLLRAFPVVSFVLG